MDVFNHAREAWRFHQISNVRESMRIETSGKTAGNRFFPACTGAIVALCFAAAVGWSQEVPPYRGLTFEHAILQSLQKHPELADYVYQLEAADARVAYAGVGPRPQLWLEIEDVAGSGDFSDVESAQSTLGISWLLQGDVIEQRVAAAHSKISVIEAQRQILQLEVAADTARYFLQAMAQQERKLLAQQAMEQARQALADIRRQVVAGKVPQADASRAEAELARRTLAVEDIQHELEVAKHQLSAQWGDRTPVFTTIVGSLSAPVPSIDIEQLRAQVAGNPNLSVFLSRERVAEAEIAVARAEAGIQWKIDAGIRRLEATDDYSLVAGVSIPIGRRSRNRDQIDALTAERNRYRSQMEAKTIELETRVYVMAQQLLHAQHVAEALLLKIIPSMERALSDTRVAYRQGKYSYYALAAAQQDLIDARLSYLEAQYRAHLNLIEIEKLTGLSLSAISETAK